MIAFSLFQGQFEDPCPRKTKVNYRQANSVYKLSWLQTTLNPGASTYIIT